MGSISLYISSVEVRHVSVNKKYWNVNNFYTLNCLKDMCEYVWQRHFLGTFVLNYIKILFTKNHSSKKKFHDSSTTLAIFHKFHDFPGLENAFTNSMTFQAWKMHLQIPWLFMTFHDRVSPASAAWNIVMADILNCNTVLY